MSDSIWNDQRITSYVLGELSGGDLTEFEHELHANADLEAAVSEARGVTVQLEQLYAAESTPPLDTDRRDAILSAKAADITPATEPKKSWRIPVVIVAIAASLLLLIGVAPQLMDGTTNVAMTPEEGKSKDVALLTGMDESALTESDYAVAGSVARQSERDDALSFEKQVSGGPSSNEGSDKQSKTRELDAIASLDDDLLEDEAEESAPKQRSLSRLGSSLVGEDKKEALGMSSPDRSYEDYDELSASTGLSVANSSPANPVPVIKSKSSKARYDSENVARGESLRRSPKSKDDQFGFAVEAEEESMGEPAVDTLAAPKVAFAGEAKRPAPAAHPFAAPDPAAAPHPTGGVANGGVAGMKFKAERARIALRLPESNARGFGDRSIKLGNGIDYGSPEPEGVGPGKSGDRFEPITENPFKRVAEHPLSTFSVDVDTASYSKTRDFLMRANQLPRPDAVRIEEFVNYFDYDYAAPESDSDHPFAATVVITGCPWNEQHRLARIALKGKEIEATERPRCNLVFLLDTSGSMNAYNKLPLVQEGMKMLLGRLNKKDRVAIVVYAGSAGLVLDSTKVGNGQKIRTALTQLSAGGSTNGGAGIALAYQTARDNFIADGVNRVILCTDGDFNVGTTGTDQLVRMVEKEAKGGVFLSVLGFGMGNHNDAMLEKVSGRGNGNYAFIDTENEARKVLVDQTSGTLVTIAKDVKLQIEFNPEHISAYRLIGYENRILAKEDFNDDKKDAGEIGAGHAVTALYELVPAGVQPDATRPKVDPLKYQTKLKQTKEADSDETMTLKLRYKQPRGDTSTLVEFPVVDDDEEFESSDDDVRFAAAVAGFGMQLRRSQYKGNWTLGDVRSVAKGAKSDDEFGFRAEFVEMVRKASELMGQE